MRWAPRWKRGLRSTNSQSGTASAYPASQTGMAIGCCAVDTFTPSGNQAVRGLVAIVWIMGEPVVRTPGKKDKPLRLCAFGRAYRDQKSPVRRCFKSRSPVEDRVRRLASGCRFMLDDFPASCPEHHRPTHDHRHVRMWARRYIGQMRAVTSIFLPQAQKNQSGRPCEPHA